METVTTPYHEYHIDAVASDRQADALRILCVLPTLNPYGGVISVVNAMNILVDRGHHVTLVSLSKNSVDLVYPRMEPVRIELGSDLPLDWAFSHDVAVATWWETTPMVHRLGMHNPALTTFDYIQDFAGDFYGNPNNPLRAQALDTYDLISNRIVKTDHLQRRLQTLGHESVRIPPGMDLDIFYPRGDPPSTRRPGVLAMARPSGHNDNRGFEVLRETYARLSSLRPDIELSVFGTNDLPDWPYGNSFGQLQPSELPNVYSRYPVFIDTSKVHSFGRTGVEAMACGTACVLSDSGGISEYAVHGDNAIVVPVGDPNSTVKAVTRLLDDATMMDRIAQNGQTTVAAYSDYDAASALERILRSEV